jgi:hypothetical protein
LRLKPVAVACPPFGVRGTPGKGAWRPVDTRLTEDRGSKRAKTGLHQLEPEFAASAEDRGLVTMEPINISDQEAV